MTINLNLFNQNQHIFAGICAITMTLGFIRFDLGLLASVMAQADWIASSEIGDLAAFGMLGAIGGCFTQANIKNRQRATKIIQWLIFIIPVAFFLEAFNPGLSILRFIQFGSGWISGAVTTTIPSIILSFIRNEQKSTASTQLWMGGGLGAIIGALIINSLGQNQSPKLALSLIGILCLLMCIPVTITLRRYQRKLFQEKQPIFLKESEQLDKQKQFSYAKENRRTYHIVLAALSGGFIFMNLSQVPFLAMQQSIIIEKLKVSASISSITYVLLGIGSLLGSVIPAILVNRGAQIKSLLKAISLLGLCAGILFSFSNSLFIFSIAAILYGFWEMCTASLTSSRIFELVPDSEHAKVWGMTGACGQTSFAIFGFVSQLSTTSTVAPIINIGLVALAAHTVCEFIQGRYTMNTREQILPIN